MEKEKKQNEMIPQNAVRTEEELNKEELANVTGGVSDIVVTKKTDATSPSLFNESLAGKATK